MKTISLITPVNYVRPSSCSEKTLSRLSNYFYLGGSKASVIKGNEVSLKKESISWYIIALKVASFFLLFPLTLTLLVINFGLRCRHKFTISPSSPIATSIKPKDPVETKNTSDAQEDILDSLTKFAPKEGDAFLIDFSKVNPSNIFKIFNKEIPRSREVYGDVSIDDPITYDESHHFTQNFPNKYSIRIVTIEKNEYGLNSYKAFMFTMSAEGKVESYGEVFENFDLYLDHLMKRIYENGFCTFEHFDFYSVRNNNEFKTLRKKSSSSSEI